MSLLRASAASSGLPLSAVSTSSRILRSSSSILSRIARSSASRSLVAAARPWAVAAPASWPATTSSTRCSASRRERSRRSESSFSIITAAARSELFETFRVSSSSSARRVSRSATSSWISCSAVFFSSAPPSCPNAASEKDDVMVRISAKFANGRSHPHRAAVCIFNPRETGVPGRGFGP